MLLTCLRLLKDKSNPTIYVKPNIFIKLYPILYNADVYSYTRWIKTSFGDLLKFRSKRPLYEIGPCKKRDFLISADEAV